MNYLKGIDVSKALLKDYRVYLCGNLSEPQDGLQWIHDERNEIGISDYTQYTADKPHLHTTAYEYNYILKGSTKVLLIDEGEEFVFKKGSLFIIPPNTRYASKHKKNTRILFFKSPGGNDKQLVKMNEKLMKWQASWD